MEQTEAFRLLASADRQLVLHELLEKDGEATVGELSRRVAARRHGIAPEKLTDNMVERAQIRLVHTHFPCLTERNVIEINWESKEVSLTDEESEAQLFEAATLLENWPPTDLLDRPS